MRLLMTWNYERVYCCFIVSKFRKVVFPLTRKMKIPIVWHRKTKEKEALNYKKRMKCKSLPYRSRQSNPLPNLCLFLSNNFFCFLLYKKKFDSWNFHACLTWRRGNDLFQIINSCFRKIYTWRRQALQQYLLSKQ